MVDKEGRRKAPLPRFRSREEEAAFWDTHDMADYWDDFKAVKVRFAKNLSEGITIRLDPETLAKLRVEAKEKGVGPTTLARMWIMERLRERQEQKPSRRRGAQRT